MSIENWSELRDKTLGVNENYKYKASKLNEIGKQGWPWCYWVWFCIWLVDKLCKFSGPIIEQRKSKYKAIPECFGHSIENVSFLPCQLLSLQLLLEGQNLFCGASNWSFTFDLTSHENPVLPLNKTCITKE